MERQAIPGAMKLPPGAKDRERFMALEARVNALEATNKALLGRLDALEATKKPGRPRKEEE